MNLRVTDTYVPICETLADTASEQPIDCDFLLPEYCPDVAWVLKCTMTATVQNRQLTTDRLSVEGTVLITVLYLDEERRAVRCCEFSQPFATGFAVPNGAATAFLYLSASTDYVNCRAVSPRRLDVHGAFTVKLKMLATTEQSGISAIDGDGVFLRKSNLCGTVPAAFAEKVFTVNEVFDPGDQKRPAEQMLRVRMTPIVTDCKVLTNKAIIKGKLNLEALYLTDTASGTTDTVTGDVPFSQIVDMEGLTEEWLCDAKVMLLSGEMRVESPQSGEGALLSVNAKIGAVLYGWREVSGELVTDTYSSHCPLITDMHTLEVVHLHSIARDVRTVRHSVEVPSESVQSVLAVWCDVIGAGMSADGDGAVLDGRMLWCMLVRDKSGEVSYYERTESFSLPYADGGMDMAAHIDICSSSCSLGGNGKMDLKAELHITRQCGQKQSYAVLKGVAADEAAAFSPDKATLKVCYAAAGESLWDIARRCHTSVEAVMEENHLMGDIVPENTMLLVPIS